MKPVIFFFFIAMLRLQTKAEVDKAIRNYLLFPKFLYNVTGRGNKNRNAGNYSPNVNIILARLYKSKWQYTFTSDPVKTLHLYSENRRLMNGNVCPSARLFRNIEGDAVAIT